MIDKEEKRQVASAKPRTVTYRWLMGGAAGLNLQQYWTKTITLPL